MRWRWLLQRALGGVRRLPTAQLRVVQGGQSGVATRLNVEAACLDALFSGAAPVIVYRGAVAEDVCRRAAERLEALDGERREHRGVAAAFATWHLGLDAESPASDYAKLGYTKTDVLREEGFRMAAGRPASALYLDRAAETRAVLDEVFAPARSPVEDIAAELNALSGFSCLAEQCPGSGRPFLPCVVRRMEPGGRRAEGNVHMDVVEPGRTFSINVYLKVPPCQQDRGDEGGELVLWPVDKGVVSRFLNSHFFATIDVQNFYPDHKFYTDAMLQSSDLEPIVYRPKVGDVVIIDPAYPHAVRDFVAPPGHRRISLQTFVQARPPDRSGPRLLEYAV